MTITVSFTDSKKPEEQILESMIQLSGSGGLCVFVYRTDMS